MDYIFLRTFFPPPRFSNLPWHYITFNSMLPRWMIPQSKGTMVLALVAGTVLAVGHHLFYSHLAGQIPPNSIYTIANMESLTGQQINLAIGAIFVFFVKTLLSMALLTAHEQTTWRAIKTPGRATKVSVIDGLLRSTNNIFSLVMPELWKRSFLSMVLAMFSWSVLFSPPPPPGFRLFSS